MTERRNADEWQFSRHALERAVDMALGPEELREAIERPTKPLPSIKYPGCHCIYTERIVLCVNLVQRKVVTILWNNWEHGRFFQRFDREDPADLERCRDTA